MKNLNKNIILIGMPGCGKTTIGNLLATKLNLNFCDTDDYIEKLENKSIKEIFQKGEDYFRKIENKIIQKISNKYPLIISTGGGVIKSYNNIKFLKKNGIIIFINRPIKNILLDINICNRPLLKDGKEKIYTLYKERYPLYKKYCDYEIKNNTTLENAINKILYILS